MSRSSTRNQRREAHHRGSGFVPGLLAIVLTLGSGQALAAHGVGPTPRPRSTSAQSVSAPPEASRSATGLKSISTRQHADNLYRQAAGLLQQGRTSQALTTLRQALNLLPTHHESRQALAFLLAADGNLAAGVKLLARGVALAPQQIELRLALARLELEQEQPGRAYDTLSTGPPISADEPEAQALLAATLQRLGRHQDAVRHYLNSLRSDPAEPRWLIGLAISLQALGHKPQAVQAYDRALELGALTPEQEAFVRRQLQDLAP